MGKLVGLCRDYSFAAFGGFVAVQDYDRVVTPELKALWRHPYYFCFQLTLQAIIHGMRWEQDGTNHFAEPFDPSIQIAFIFDQQPEFSARATELYFEIKAQHDPDNRLGLIGFGDKRKYPPLQAADLLQARHRRMLRRKFDGDEQIKPGSWDDDLTRLKNQWIHY